MTGPFPVKPHQKLDQRSVIDRFPADGVFVKSGEDSLFLSVGAEAVLADREFVPWDREDQATGFGVAVDLVDHSADPMEAVRLLDEGIGAGVEQVQELDARVNEASSFARRLRHASKNLDDVRIFRSGVGVDALGVGHHSDSPFLEWIGRS